MLFKKAMNYRLVVVATLTSLSCTASQTTKHHSFTEETYNQVRVGMTATEVEAIFGRPDMIYETKYGEATPKSWEALVWKYYIGSDNSYRHVSKSLTNTFVFWKGVEPPKLNYWQFESRPSQH
jgi:hypothetical protein